MAKQLYNKPCVISLGKFYGTRHFSNWLTYSSPNYNLLPNEVQKGLMNSTRDSKVEEVNF